jgi:hypothetical protein
MFPSSFSRYMMYSNYVRNRSQNQSRNRNGRRNRNCMKENKKSEPEPEPCHNSTVPHHCIYKVAKRKSIPLNNRTVLVLVFDSPFEFWPSVWVNCPGMDCVYRPVHCASVQYILPPGRGGGPDCQTGFTAVSGAAVSLCWCRRSCPSSTP